MRARVATDHHLCHWSKESSVQRKLQPISPWRGKESPKQQLTACNSPRPSVELEEARGHAPGTPKDGAHELLRSAQVGRAGTEPAGPPPPACWLLPHSKKTPGRRYAHPSEGPGAAGNAGLDCGGGGGRRALGTRPPSFISPSLTSQRTGETQSSESSGATQDCEDPLGCASHEGRALAQRPAQAEGQVSYTEPGDCGQGT